MFDCLRNSRAVGTEIGADFAGDRYKRTFLGIRKEKTRQNKEKGQAKTCPVILPAVLPAVHIKKRG